MQASALILRWGSYHWAHNLRSLIIYLFPPCYVALYASKAHHRLGSESVSWCLETSLLKIPFPGWDFLPGTELPPYLLCLFFCLLNFFLPVFEDNDLLFWVPNVLCQYSVVFFVKLLSVEMFFS